MRLLWLLVAVLPVGASAQTNEASLLQAQKITQVNIYQGERLAATEHYDSRGNLIASADDSFLQETLRHSNRQQFNAQNQVVYSKRTHSSMPDTIFWRFHYNDRHLLTSVTDGYSGKEVQHLEYNTLGQLMRRTLTSPDGQLVSDERFTYDAQGSELECALEGEYIKGRVSRKTYDAQGREVKSELFDKGTLSFTTLTEYRPSGEKSKVTYIDDGRTYGVRYTYDGENRLLSRIHFSREKRQEVTTGTEEFTYTPTGLIKTFMEDIFSFRHVKRTFSYVYN